MIDFPLPEKVLVAFNPFKMPESALQRTLFRPLLGGGGDGPALFCSAERPDDPTSKRLMADAFDALGENTLNTPARHYSFSYANRLRREAGDD